MPCANTRAGAFRKRDSRLQAAPTGRTWHRLHPVAQERFASVIRGYKPRQQAGPGPCCIQWCRSALQARFAATSRANRQHLAPVASSGAGALCKRDSRLQAAPTGRTWHLSHPVVQERFASAIRGCKPLLQAGPGTGCIQWCRSALQARFAATSRANRQDLAPAASSGVGALCKRDSRLQAAPAGGTWHLSHPVV